MKLLLIANHEDTLLQFRTELINRLVNDKNEVVVLVPKGARSSDFEKLKVELQHYDIDQHGINPIHDLKLLKVYKSKIKKISPDVVLTYTIKPNVYAGYACRKLKVRYIPTITGLGQSFERSKILKSIVVAMMKKGLKKAQTVFYQNQTNFDLLVNYGIANGRGKLVKGSGVNLEIHKFEEYPNNTKVRLLFVGRIAIDKGIRELIDAAKILKKENLNLEFYTLGNVESDCENIIKEAENENLICQYGLHTHVHDYIKQCDAVILPSYHEGMSNALLEAAACGRPILATNIPGCKETFVDGISGFGFEPKNVDNLVKTIKKFLELNRQQRADMGVEARKHIEKEFDRNKVIDSYLVEIYK